MVPDVAVEDFSECVKETDHDSHHAKKGNSGQGGDALQDRIHPHTRHLVHPACPGREGTSIQREHSGTVGS